MKDTFSQKTFEQAVEVLKCAHAKKISLSRHVLNRRFLWLEKAMEDARDFERRYSICRYFGKTIFFLKRMWFSFFSIQGKDAVSLYQKSLRKRSLTKRDLMEDLKTSLARLSLH